MGMRKVQAVIQKIALVLYDYLIDPVVLVFILFVIFPHWQNVYNDTVGKYGINISKLANGVWEDMVMYPVLYIIFGIIVAVWIALKWYKVRSEKQSQDEIITLLKQIRDKKIK